MIRARLIIRAQDRKASQAIIRAIRPDNVGMKGLRVKALSYLKSATFAIEYNGKIETFISSLDDMLSCIQAAKGTLSTLVRKSE